MSRTPLAALAVLLLLGCVGGGGAPPGCDGVTEPSDCAALSQGSWRVGNVFGADDTARIVVGESVKKLVLPGLPADCAQFLTATAWSVEDASVAAVGDVSPANDNRSRPSAWITGRAPGQTAVRARLSFRDGSTTEAQPAILRVDLPDPRPPRRAILAEDSLPLSAQLVPFAVPRPGRIEVVLDWGSVSNSPLFWVYEGDCAAAPCSGRVVAQYQVHSTDRKPLRAAADVAAGPHTLRLIPSLSSGPDTVHYLVHLAP
jgi:hypothetical protein